ncbi:MAG: PhnD/SsuA/transferrin family substrate-binding protein [Anaerolineales bacterium]|nr:PhnD/SsuA/transferrin family substrate-binding protein [Anaerolineales bacterium]
MITAGDLIAAFIESRTGYRIVTVAPASETALVEALNRGNAHIASLSPFAYLLARENRSVTAVMASVREGQAFYGAQFIANRESGLISFYDAVRNENTTALAAEALKQLENKKPCWSDNTSPSGVCCAARIAESGPGADRKRGLPRRSTECGAGRLCGGYL